MENWNFHNWGMPMMWLIWLPILVLVIWLIVRLVNNRAGIRSLEDQKESPLEILERRYANGEITKEEFEERRSTLKGNEE